MSTPSSPPSPSSQKPGLTLRPLVDADLDADAAWLRASVEAFEPRLRELTRRGLEASGEVAGDGAWAAGRRLDLGCGSVCACCPPRQRFLDLDRWRGDGGRRGDAALVRRLAAATRAGRPVVLGATADPYGGDAAHRARTRRLLEAFRGVDGAELRLTTATPIVLCDLDLLVEVDATSSLSFEMVVPTADPDLAKRLEPGAPGPAERLGAVREIAAEGIAATVRVAPLMPGVNDGLERLRPLVGLAAAAGAVDVVASPLRLPWRARRRFFAWLESEAPERLREVRRLYGWRRALPGERAAALLADLEVLRLEQGFPRALPGRS